jgi:hypothetical protein
VFQKKWNAQAYDNEEVIRGCSKELGTYNVVNNQCFRLSVPKKRKRCTGGYKKTSIKDEFKI